MILEFQHTDILSPQRRMEATAENTLIAEGKRENQRLRNQRERLDQDCFEVHVARVWTRQDGKLSAGTNGDLCLPRQLQISSLPLVILIGAPSWGLFIPLMPYGASGDQQQQVLLMADRARQAEHSKREEQEGTHSQTEACSLHPVLRVVASISRESYTALKKSCELCCEKS